MPATTRAPQSRPPGPPPGHDPAAANTTADHTGPQMTATGAARHHRSAPARALRRSGAVLAAAASAFAVLIYGGYQHHWPWTGIDGKTATLWDWLHLLLLPVAVMIAPIWVRRREHLRARHKAAGITIVTAFAALVLSGYLTPWRWTGFPGNTLWDWLGLLALPLTVALIPVIREVHARWQRRDGLIVLAALLVFLLPVLGGYLAGWTWTGFRGNTLWDWLHLLILPLLVPTVLIPALKPLATPGPRQSQQPSPALAEPQTAPAPARTVPGAATLPPAPTAKSPSARLPPLASRPSSAHSRSQSRHGSSTSPSRPTPPADVGHQILQ